MAGYFIYSIDFDAFQEFAKEPTDKQLKKFSESLDDQYEEVMDEFEEEEEDDTLAKSWSSDSEDVEKAIREHLKKDDWYDGVGQFTAGIWSRAIEEMAQEFDFRVDSDGIYWDLIEMATKQFSNKSDQHVVARFGRCPYSVKAIETFEPKEWGDAWWDPYHSMHPPAEVKKLIEELESMSEAIESSNNDQAKDDFQELMPALDKISKDNRMLYVSVDT